jgi:hypothetical protein
VILRAVLDLDEGAQMDELAALLVALMEPPPPFMVFVPPSFGRERSALDPIATT